MRFLEEIREWKLPGLLYADDLVLCDESEEDLRAMTGWFAEVCRRRGPKANASKSKVKILNREEGLECDVCVYGMHLEYRDTQEYIKMPRVTEEQKIGNLWFRACLGI